jgi:hypothetical protein
MVSADTNVQSTTFAVSAEIACVGAITKAGGEMRAEHYRIGELGQSRFSPAPHVVTPRRGFLHHGIYMGDGKVVHYSGSTHGLFSGPIEEISLDRFTCGRPVWANCETPVSYSADEVIRRARSRVGENHYRLFSNNCEHFC